MIQLGCSTVVLLFRLEWGGVWAMMSACIQSIYEESECHHDYNVNIYIHLVPLK